MSKEKRLGRGLEALLGKVAAAQPDYDAPVSTAEADLSARSEGLSLYRDDTPENDSADAILGEMMKGRPILDIPIGKIDPNPYQPRVDFEPSEIASLADNLREHGMIQPITLRKNGERFQLIAGERRLRAAQSVGWETVPAYFLVVDDREMAELALSENIQRKDLNAIEKAMAFRNYLDAYGGNQGDLARRLGLDRSTISNLMRLLDLPDELQKAVCKDEISQGHARALLPLEEAEQFDVARRIVAETWSVRQTEEFVRNLLDAENDEPIDERTAPPKRSAATQKDAHLADLEQQFRSLFGSKVKLTTNERGGGKLVISFRSNDDFERIYQLILNRMR